MSLKDGPVPSAVMFMTWQTCESKHVMPCSLQDEGCLGYCRACMRLLDMVVKVVFR